MPGYQEPSVHPAAYPDPEADAYENGDTSSWAEDPTKGPYANTSPPALPGTEEPQGHPATDPKHYFPAGATKQAAVQMRKAAEVKAAKCIRIAQAMLGKKASVQAIEDQALDLMSLNDRQIQAALKRVADGMTGSDLMAVDNMTLTPPREACGEVMADEDTKAEELLAQMMAEEEGLTSDDAMMDEMMAAATAGDDDPEDEALLAMLLAEEQKKLAAARKRAGQNDPKTYMADESTDEADEKLLEAMMDEEAKKTAKKSEEEPEEKETPAEASKKAAHFKRLAAYWAKVAEETPEEKKSEEVKEEAKEEDKPAAKKAEEAKPEEKKSEESKPEEKPAEEKEEKKAALKVLAGLKLSDDLKAELAALLADEAEEPKAEEAPVACGEPVAEEPVADDFLMDDMGMDDPLLDAPLEDDLALLYGTKVAEEKEEPKAEEEPKEEPKAGKTAAVKPQPRKPSTGARALGAVAKVASSDVDDLSKLWESAPDVSKIFG
jgi:hypothetical protein